MTPKILRDTIWHVITPENNNRGFCLEKASFLICGTAAGKQKTHLSDIMINGSFYCRGDLTRTDDPLHPMQVR